MKLNVNYFKKKLDFIFMHIYWIIGIVIGVILLYCKNDIERFLFNFFEGISKKNNDIISGLVIAFLSSAPVFLSSRLKKIKSLILRFKSSLYIFLLNCYEGKQNGILHILIPQIIKLFYSYERSFFSEQQQLTTQILDKLVQPGVDKKNIFWIVGEAYCGKTSAILNLLTDLITKEEYYKLFEKVDNRIEYFDCGRDDSDMQIFSQAYKKGKYKKSIVIIDNVHKITQEQGIRQINEIAGLFNSLAIIIITRPLQEFVMQKEVIDCLEITMNHTGYKYMLCNQITMYDYTTINDFWEFVRLHQLNQYTQKGIILFHFIKIYLKSGNKKNIVNSIANFLNNNEKTDLSILLRYIIVASIFTGSFNIKMIFSEIQNKISIFKIYHLINELYNIGFLNAYPNANSSYYFFHEELAKFYFSITYTSQLDDYNLIISQYYRYYYNKGKKYYAYLYSLLIDNNQDNGKIFEQVAINVNYRIMLKDIDYLINVNPKLCSKYHKERGILYDRSGELAQAQLEYKEYYELASPEQKIDAFYKIVQVDHDFYVTNIDELQRSKPIQDVYSRLLAQYWDIHLNMHLGIFQVDKMSILLGELNQYAEELFAKRPYDSLHLMRRSFFDFYRLYYISGTGEYQKLNLLIYKNIDNILKQTLEEYQAYYNKFIYGHYLLYEVLFKIGIFGERISKEEFDLIFMNVSNMSYEELFVEENIINHAQNFYRKSYDYLYNIGDKTYYFVNCRYMEALTAYGKYEEPKRFYLEFLNYAKAEGIVYYQLCAEIYLFKLEFVHLFSQECLFAEDSIYQDKYRETKEHLHVAKEYSKHINPTNSYLEVVLDLYETLFTYKERKNKDYLKQQLSLIYDRCKMNNYFRELKVIHFIQRNNYLLRPNMLKNIIRYYPFVAP